MLRVGQHGGRHIRLGEKGVDTVQQKSAAGCDDAMRGVALAYRAAFVLFFVILIFLCCWVFSGVFCWPIIEKTITRYFSILVFVNLVLYLSIDLLILVRAIKCTKEDPYLQYQEYTIPGPEYQITKPFLHPGPLLNCHVPCQTKHTTLYFHFHTAQQ